MTNFTEFSLIEINVPVSLVRYSETIYKKYHFTENPLHFDAFLSTDALMHQPSAKLAIAAVENNFSETDTETFYGRLLRENTSSNTVTVHLFSTFTHPLKQIYQENYAVESINLSDSLGNRAIQVNRDICHEITMDELLARYSSKNYVRKTPNNFTVAKNLQEFINDYQKEIHIAYRLGLFTKNLKESVHNNFEFETDSAPSELLSSNAITTNTDKNLTLEDFLRNKPDSMSVEEFLEDLLEDTDYRTSINDYLDLINDPSINDYLTIKMTNKETNDSISFTIFVTEPYNSDLDEITSEEIADEAIAWIAKVINDIFLNEIANVLADAIANMD